MSPEQLIKLQELSLAFSNGVANPKQIQQLSTLLAQINCDEEKELLPNDQVEFMTTAHFCSF